MSRARRGVLWLAVLAFVAGGAGAQDPGREASPGPDVPAGPAAVVGQLRHPSRPEAVAGLDVILYALAADGSAGLRQGRSDAEGRFRFDDVSNDPEVVYLLGARLSDVPFGERFRFAAGELEQRVELVLSDPRSDASPVTRSGADLRLDRGCSHLRVSHSHSLTNPGDAVISIPEAERASAQPLFEVEIPEAAEGFESILGREGLEREGRRVRFWGPLYPGEQQVEFGYGLPLDTRELRIGFPAGAPPLQVVAPRDGLSVRGAGLEAGADRQVEGQPYASLVSEGLAPGGELELAIAVESEGAAPLHTPQAELWVELDDAAVEVNERLEVQVDAPGGLAARASAPWLCLDVPPGAQGLRFSSSALAAGLRRDPSGELAIHGPLPAGTTQLAVSYRLPASSEGATLERRFDHALPLLSVLVADNGVIPETQRLHRRRSVRASDRLYLHLEAFAIEPGEILELGLRRTPPRGGGGRWASLGFALVAGLAGLGFLLGPLRGEATPPPAEADDGRLRERDALVRALEDLDHDLETGKLSAEDHAAMRAEMRSKAAARLLPAAAAQADTTAGPAAPPERPDAAADRGTTADACGHCAAPREAGDRFCGQCGAAFACGECGAAPRPGDSFCSQCGSKLAASAGAK